MNDITKRVLKLIINELSLIFINLRVNKIKAKKGRKIEWVKFTFNADKILLFYINNTEKRILILKIDNQTTIRIWEIIMTHYLIPNSNSSVSKII